VLAMSTTAFRPDFSRTLVQMRGAVPGQWNLARLPRRWRPAPLASPGTGDPPLELLVEEASACAGGRLLFVPHLGGRILPSAPEARGAWVASTFPKPAVTSPAPCLKASLSSTRASWRGPSSSSRTFVPRDVRVIGGGGENALWNLIKASALGLPYVRLGRESFSCWGAAMVAAAAVGLSTTWLRRPLAATAEAGRTGPDPLCSPFTTSADATTGPSSTCSFRRTRRYRHEKPVPPCRARCRACGDGARTQRHRSIPSVELACIVDADSRWQQGGR